MTSIQCLQMFNKEEVVLTASNKELNLAFRLCIAYTLAIEEQTHRNRLDSRDMNIVHENGSVQLVSFLKDYKRGMEICIL